MSHDYDPTTPLDDEAAFDEDSTSSDLPDDTPEGDDEDERIYEALREVTRSTVFRLGRLGVPAAVLADAKSRKDSAQAIATILQMSVDEEDRDDYEPPTAEHTRDMLAIRSRNPSLKLSTHGEFSEKMACPPIDKTKPSAGAENFWTAVRTFSPYEHSAVRKVQLAVTAEPYTGASTATTIISFRPSTFSSATGISRLATLKNALEQLNPVDGNESSEKTYVLDGQAKGIGVLWRDDDFSGTVTVEMRELDVIIRQSFERGNIERDEKDNVIQSILRRYELYRRLGAHQDLMTRRLPVYIEFLLQLWPDETLPEITFELEANKHMGEGSLEELRSLVEEQDLK